MPEFFSPQLATLVSEPPAGDEWLHELKFDGYRMLYHLSRGKERFLSRNGKDWTEKFPGLLEALKKFPAASAILDGEIVIPDKEGRSSFQKLQQAMKSSSSPFIFEIFDLVYVDGWNLTGTPLRERKALLHEGLLLACLQRGPPGLVKEPKANELHTCTSLLAATLCPHQVVAREGRQSTSVKNFL